MVLWTDSATRCGVMKVGVAQSRDRHHVFEMPRMWQRRMLCRRQLGTRSTLLLEEGEDKLVWMQRRKEAERRTSKRLEKYSKERESGMAQRGKGAVKQCMVRKTGRHSKRSGKGVRGRC